MLPLPLATRVRKARFPGHCPLCDDGPMQGRLRLVPVLAGGAGCAAWKTAPRPRRASRPASPPHCGRVTADHGEGDT